MNKRIAMKKLKLDDFLHISLGHVFSCLEMEIFCLFVSFDAATTTEITEIESKIPENIFIDLKISHGLQKKLNRLNSKDTSIELSLFELLLHFSLKRKVSFIL
jgi:hypothetical protein